MKMAQTNFLKLSLYLFGLLISALSPSLASDNVVSIFPSTCGRIECPSFDVIDSGKGFEIRRFNSSMWMATSPIENISFVDSTKAGFRQLLAYIRGKNSYNKKIDMTAPVLTHVSPSDGPLCDSSFVVSLYVPKKNQADPPASSGLNVQNWGTKYVAVRQFGGFASVDSDVGQEAAALHASLANSKWLSLIEKSRAANPTKSNYTVAQYSSRFEFQNRVNEIWFLFDIEK